MQFVVSARRHGSRRRTVRVDFSTDADVVRDLKARIQTADDVVWRSMNPSQTSLSSTETTGERNEGFQNISLLHI